MPDYQYVARELTGKEVTGQLAAGTESEVAAVLSSQQLFPLRISLATSEKTTQRQHRGVRARHLAAFYSQLSDLLRSGVPLLRSIELLEKQTVHVGLKSIVGDVRDSVADGTPLAQAMKEHPKVFSELAVSMVRAGEEGGFLEDVLKRISVFTEHQQELKSRVVGAVAYPLFLLGLGTLVVSILIVWFVPKFAPIFERLEKTEGLPLTTATLLKVSDILGSFWWLIALALLGAVVGFIQYSKTERGRWMVDNARIKMKGWGPVYRSLAISRFCRILGTLLRNGVPILQSLQIAKDATGNVVLAEAIGDAAENISKGESLAIPLKASGQFPQEVIEMISVGEEANNLEEVLINVAESMESRTYRQLDLFVRLIEPLMLMIMAGVILFVAIGLLLPVFKSSGLV